MGCQKNYLQKMVIIKKNKCNQIANYLVLNKTINIAIHDKTQSDFQQMVKNHVSRDVHLNSQ